MSFADRGNDVSMLLMKKSLVKKLLIGLLTVFILAVVLIAGLFVYASGNKAYVMDGPSMEPTINNGEKVKAKVVPANEVQRGDIIVFTSPIGENKRLLKRVVGLPGDTVTVANGELLVTKPDNTTYKPYNDNNTPGDSTVTVKSNSFYVVGDNRANSLDSRIESFGQVPFDALLSVVKE